MLLVIQNNSHILNQAKTCLPPSMLSSSSIACLFIGKFKRGCSNIVQTSDVVRLVVFLLFLLCLQAIVRLFLPRETIEMFRHFVLTIKKQLNLVPMSSRLTVQFFGNYAVEFTSFFTYRKLPNLVNSS